MRYFTWTLELVSNILWVIVVVLPVVILNTRRPLDWIDRSYLLVTYPKNNFFLNVDLYELFDVNLTFLNLLKFLWQHEMKGGGTLFHLVPLADSDFMTSETPACQELKTDGFGTEVYCIWHNVWAKLQLTVFFKEWNFSLFS